jgi:hypothetical protein
MFSHGLPPRPPQTKSAFTRTTLPQQNRDDLFSSFQTSPPAPPASPSSAASSPSTTFIPHTAVAQQRNFLPIRRRQPFGGFDDRSSNPSSPRNTSPAAAGPSMLREIPSKVRKIAHESVYDKTLRLLMTADQNVEFMEEDEDDGGGNEDDQDAQPLIGQRSILQFFTKSSTAMEED